MAENETSNDVLQNVESIIEKSSSEIPDVTIDRANLGWNVRALLFAFLYIYQKPSIHSIIIFY